MGTVGGMLRGCLRGAASSLPAPCCPPTPKAPPPSITPTDPSPPSSGCRGSLQFPITHRASLNPQDPRKVHPLLFPLRPPLFLCALRRRRSQ